MKLKFTKTFKFAHGGTQIESFQPGQVVENPSDRLYDVAISEKAAIDPEIKEDVAFGQITADLVTTGELITKSTQIEDAIIAVATVDKPEKKPTKTKS